MTLIVCTECKQQISSEAISCPHCGCPNTILLNTQHLGRGYTRKFIIGVTLLLLLGDVFYLAKESSQIKSHDSLYVPVRQQITPSLDKSKQVVLQEVRNLGYVFFLGQIDSASTTVITDDLKNQITKIAYNAHFPASLLKNIPIIILNNLALTGDQYISTTDSNLKIPDLKADFLSEGGIYVTFNSGSSVIFINKATITRGDLTEVLTHELGHAVGSKLTDQEWDRFYKLRSIASSTPRRGLNWNLSPQEDFAEVYKSTFAGGSVKTYYGLLTGNFGEETVLNPCWRIHHDLEDSYTPKRNLYDFSKPFEKIDYAAIELRVTSNPEMQDCRRDVLLNPDKYPNDFKYGIPYESIVSQEAKDFIISITNRLNKQYSQ